MEESIKYVNSITEEQFVSLFGNVVEHTAQVAHQMFKVKPFRDSESFLSVMDTVINSLSLEEKVYEIINNYINYQKYIIRSKSSVDILTWPGVWLTPIC